MLIRYARPDGRIVERETPRELCFDELLEDGELLRPIHHDTRVWGFYRADGLEPRAFYSADGGHPPERTIDGVVYSRFWDGQSAAGIPGARIVKGAEITYRDLPASRQLPRRSGGTIANRFGHTVREHPDGGLTTLDGRPIIATAQDEARECSRTGMVRIDAAADPED